jgi:hypothetical protein
LPLPFEDESAVADAIEAFFLSIALVSQNISSWES